MMTAPRTIACCLITPTRYCRHAAFFADAATIYYMPRLDAVYTRLFAEPVADDDADIRRLAAARRAMFIAAFIRHAFDATCRHVNSARTPLLMPLFLLFTRALMPRLMRRCHAIFSHLRHFIYFLPSPSLTFSPSRFILLHTTSLLHLRLLHAAWFSHVTITIRVTASRCFIISLLHYYAAL